jgi:hypothetical protein
VLVAKRFEIMNEVVPSAARVAVLFHTGKAMIIRRQQSKLA